MDSYLLTHQGQVLHICINKLETIIGLDNSLLLVQHQAIIWRTNADIFVNWMLGNKPRRNLNQSMLIEVKKMHLKMMTATWRPFCFCLMCQPEPVLWRNHPVCIVKVWFTWWHHKKGTFSMLLAFCEGNPPVTGGFHSQRPVIWSFDVFFVLHLSKHDLIWKIMHQDNSSCNGHEGDEPYYGQDYLIISSSGQHLKLLLSLWD